MPEYAFKPLEMNVSVRSVSEGFVLCLCAAHARCHIISRERQLSTTGEQAGANHSPKFGLREKWIIVTRIELSHSIIISIQRCNLLSARQCPLILRSFSAPYHRRWQQRPGHAAWHPGRWRMFRSHPSNSRKSCGSNSSRNWMEVAIYSVFHGSWMQLSCPLSRRRRIINIADRRRQRRRVMRTAQQYRSSVNHPRRSPLPPILPQLIPLQLQLLPQVPPSITKDAIAGVPTISFLITVLQTRMLNSIVPHPRINVQYGSLEMAMIPITVCSVLRI